MNDNSLEQLKYEMFLAEQMLEQAKMKSFISECLLISEGTNSINNMELIQESFADKLKEVIMKIVNGIATMWKKFIETMSTLVKRDKAYLEKYKDTILKKKPIDCDYTMYDYFTGQKVLLNSPVPNFNFQSMKDDLETSDKFTEKHFANFIQGQKSPYNLEDLAKAKFRGGGQEKTFHSSKINMTDMYNYCHEYDKLKDYIQKDINNIQKAATDASDMVDKMAREGQIQKEGGLFDKKQYFSVVYEQYITETEKPSQPAPNSGDNNASPGGVKISKPENNNSNDNNSNENNNNNSTQTSNPAEAYKKNTGESNSEVSSDEKSAQDVINRINNYLKVCGGFLGAKQTVAEEIYKAYMSIIKAHIRDSLNKGKNDGNKVADVGTNQSDNSDNGEGNDNPNNNDSNDNNKSETKKSVGTKMKNTVESIKNAFK